MFIIGILFVGISLIISNVLKSKFARYAKIHLKSDFTGAEVAAKMLYDHHIHDVKIIQSSHGHLSDHYNPINKTVALSEEVYFGKNAAAAAVAAHECGHAVQHAKGYAFLKFRSAMVPMLSVTSRYMPWVIMGGILMINTTPIPLTIGIVFFSFTTLFSFVTLPVEFDASKRALQWMSRKGIVDYKEKNMAQDALKWAALTYVVAALGSLAQLLHLISILNSRRD